MSKPAQAGSRPELALLLAAPDFVEMQLARGLLEEAGIPFLTHGPEFYRAGLGNAVHDGVQRRPDLFVPSAELERARGLLNEAWGRDGGPGPPSS